jgi:hypothetical protein
LCLPSAVSRTTGQTRLGWRTVAFCKIVAGDRIILRRVQGHWLLRGEPLLLWLLGSIGHVRSFEATVLQLLGVCEMSMELAVDDRGRWGFWR